MEKGKAHNRPVADPWATALRLLTRRDYSSGELRQRLLTKGFPAPAVEGAMARALELGYLDDARLICRLSKTLLAQGRAAGVRLALELSRRGFPREMVDAAVATAGGQGEEERALRALIDRRFAAFDFNTADERERRRVVAFLQRRGFPLDRILIELKRTDS